MTSSEPKAVPAHVMRPPMKTALLRALKLHCPNCGEGKILSGYIKPVESCAICQEKYSHIRTDDAAPWLSILLVGHIFVPTILSVQQELNWPDWLSMTVWPALVLAFALLFLPWAKAFFLTVIWAMRAPGSEKR